MNNWRKHKEYEKIKAVEFHTGSAYGRPGVIADIHLDDGRTIVRMKDFSNKRFRKPADARAVADQEAHRMAAMAKSKGVPVIIHSMAADARRAQEADARRFHVPAVTPNVNEYHGSDRHYFWLIILVPVLLVIVIEVILMMVGK
jgi:hypothetical protein